MKVLGRFDFERGKKLRCSTEEQEAEQNSEHSGSNGRKLSQNAVRFLSHPG